MALKLIRENEASNATPVPNLFIDRYMPEANPSYSVVYITILRMVCAEQTASLEEIAEIVHMLPSDVARALEYWESQGILRYNKEKEEIVLSDLTLREGAKEKKILAVQNRPTYQPAELAYYMEHNKTVKELLLSAQHYMGKLLSQNDMSVIFSFYDWLRLPVDVIEVLLAYCAENGHRNIRYIEKVAVDWAEAGIDTKEKAFARINGFHKEYHALKKHLGVSGREFTPAEEGFIKRWLEEYRMPVDVIQYACEKAVLQTGAPKLPYIEKILSAWNQRNLHTLAEVQRQEEAFQAGKQAGRTNISRNVEKPKEAPAKKNRFVNYDQRQWDFDQMKQLKRKSLEKKLEG